MRYTNCVYYREENVFAGKMGSFPSLMFIRDELNDVADCLQKNHILEKGASIYSKISAPIGRVEFVLPAVFLSHERKYDYFLVKRYYDKICQEHPDETEPRWTDDIRPEKRNRKKTMNPEDFWKMKRWGDYSFEKHLITLYIPNIEEDAHTLEELKTILSMVLAHELFHAYQYFVSPEKSRKYKNLVSANGKSSTTVKVMEATADYFAFQWLTSRKEQVVWYEESVRKDRFESWQRNSFASWPYAGAKYCVRDYPNKKMIMDWLDIDFMDTIGYRHHEVMDCFMDPRASIGDAYRLLVGK